MKPLYLTGLCALMMCFAFSASAQRTCTANDKLLQQIADDPARAAVMEDIERHTEQFIASGAAATEAAVITIPVVFHVVYGNSSENLSDAEVLSQLQVLNEDFRRTNSDADGTWSQAADTEIQFCLATVDPSGNPTTGIIRTSTSVGSFSFSSDNVKFTSSGGSDAWPSGQYLNYWICDLSSGLLGYAQFPGGPASTDGVVCDYAYTGTIGASAPFDLGRTGTHEVGHWLNLRHIWGDGGCSVDDFVSDTPTSNGANYGCAAGSSSCSSTDMVQNYMDYSDDDCMNLFTAGQKARMQALFAAGGVRQSILSSPACGTPADPTCDDGIQNGSETGVDCGGPDCDPCPPCTDVVITINLDNYPEETSWTLTNSSGSLVASGGTYGSEPDGSTVVETVCVPDDCYVFTIDDAFGDGICCGFGSGDYNVSTGGVTVASGGEFTDTESTSFCVPASGGCVAPTGLTTGSITSSSAVPQWNAVPGALAYQAQGRRAGIGAYRQKNVTTNFVNVPGLSSGTTYEWQVRVQCASGAFSPFSPLATFTTSAPRLGTMDVEVYPNPAQNQVQLAGLPTGALSYAVFDRTGRMVANGTRGAMEGSVLINTSEFASGLYLIKWNTDLHSGVEHVSIAK